MRQIISPSRTTSHVDDVMKAKNNYAVCRTKPDCVSEVYNLGRYIDELTKKRRLLEIQESPLRVRQRGDSQLAKLSRLI